MPASARPSAWSRRPAAERCRSTAARDVRPFENATGRRRPAIAGETPTPADRDTRWAGVPLLIPDREESEAGARPCLRWIGGDGPRDASPGDLPRNAKYAQTDHGFRMRGLRACDGGFPCRLAAVLLQFSPPVRTPQPAPRTAYRALRTPRVSQNRTPPGPFITVSATATDGLLIRRSKTQDQRSDRVLGRHQPGGLY